MISPALSKWVKRFNVTVAILALGYVVFSFGYVVGKMKASVGARTVTRGVDASTGKPFEYIENAKLSDLEIDAIVNAKDTPEHPLSARTEILQEHFKKEWEQQAKAETSGIKSILCTNYVKWANPGGVENLEVATKIYDVGFIVYSREFAKRFGYPESHVYSLDKGVHVMEFRLTTRGVRQDCYLNVLMEKGLGLDVPAISYVKRAGYAIRFRFPKEIKGFELSPEDMAYHMKATYEPHGDVWETYYSRNFYLATLDYVPEKIGSCDSEMLAEFSNTYYSDFDYFSISIGTTITQRILKKGAVLWIKKKGGADYSKQLNENPDDFYKIKIPQSLANAILPLMKETDSYSFLNNMKGVMKNVPH